MSFMLLWCSDVSLQLFPMIMTLLCHMILLIYASAENWKDSNGRDMAPGRFWNSGIETTLWQQFPPTIQALVWALNWIYGSRPRCIHFNWNIFIHTMSVSSLYIIMIFIMELIFIAFCRYESYDVKQCTHWWEAEASTVVMMPSITAKSSKGTLAVWETIPSSLCCQTNLLGFCLSFMLFGLKA